MITSHPTPIPQTPPAQSLETPSPKGAGGSAGAALDKIKEIIAEQTGYTTDMLEDTLDLEADLGIDTVKQVEIFAKAAAHFGFPVPEDLKLRDLNTIAKLADYINTKAAPLAPDTPPAGGDTPSGSSGDTQGGGGNTGIASGCRHGSSGFGNFSNFSNFSSFGTVGSASGQ